MNDKKPVNLNMNCRDIILEFNGNEYDVLQMKEIIAGIMKGVAVESYIDPKFSPIQIKAINRCLEKHEGLTPEDIVKFNQKQLKEIIDGIERGIDVLKYANPEFSVEQMSLIKRGLIIGADVSYYADPRYTVEQMMEIFYGLDRRLDVSKYADPALSVEQMEMIRKYMEMESEKTPNSNVNVYSSDDEIDPMMELLARAIVGL